MSLLTSKPIKIGDLIRVTHTNAIGEVDLSITGTITTPLSAGSSNRFKVALPGSEKVGGVEVELSVNEVDVTLIFAADVARNHR
jgi:hypothetical protein